MERLKAILADKILDLSASNGDEVKTKIDKIQRFRDFANACKTLMNKYPAIEDELINMVEDGDFDTKVASSRVDTVIRLADTEQAQIKKVEVPLITESEETNDDSLMMESEISEAIEEASIPETIPTIDDIPMEIYQGEEEEIISKPEDIEYEELEPTEKEYVPFEDVQSYDTESEVLNEEIISEPDSIIEQTLYTKENIQEEFNEYEQAAKRKIRIRRIVQIIGAVLVVVALIFIVKFVMVHWQTILIIAGALLLLAILFVWFGRKRK